MVPQLFSLKTRKGFTLIEIMIVVALIGMLSTIGFGSYQSTQKNGRDAKRKTDLEVLRQTLELYRSDNGVYPSSPVSCEASVGAVTCGCQRPVTSCKYGNNWDDCFEGVCGGLYPALVSAYVKQIPIDPKNDATYYYNYEPVCNQTKTVCGLSVTCTSGCCAYELAAYLESTQQYYTVCNP